MIIDLTSSPILHILYYVTLVSTLRTECWAWKVWLRCKMFQSTQEGSENVLIKLISFLSANNNLKTIFSSHLFQAVSELVTSWDVVSECPWLMWGRSVAGLQWQCSSFNWKQRCQLFVECSDLMWPTHPVPWSPLHSTVLLWSVFVSSFISSLLTFCPLSSTIILMMW